MKPFNVKKINNQKIVMVINVGSYKVRAMLCSFSFSGIKILGYGEKRQSRLDVINNEINNISGLCETIKQAIIKAEMIANEKSFEIVINPFFSNTFYYSKTLSYKQKDNTVKILNKDIFNIVDNVENISIRSITNEILKKYGFAKEDLYLILSNILNLSIDGKKVKNLLNEKGEDIKIKILNSFISKVDYNNIINISNYLDKKIVKIIPEEYAIIKLGNNGVSEVFLDIGNTSTGLSIKSLDNSLKGAIRLDIGINDLVKEIIKNDSRSRSQIIKKIDREDLFKKEKKIFLSFFLDILSEGLKEILQGNICPENFILIGGGANNLFIKKFLKEKNFNDFGVKMIKNITFNSIVIDENKNISGIDKILNNSNLNIIASAISYKNIIMSENNIMEKALEKSVKKNFI